MSPKKNLNTPEFWDEEFEEEWKVFKAEGLHYYRWDALRFELIGVQVPFKGKLLDIGCGLGNFCRYIKARNPELEVWGVDFSPKGIKYAKELAERSGVKVDYMMGDAFKLPFEDSSFDIAVAMDIIEHLSAPNKFIEETKRVLKPEGKVLFTTPWKGLLNKGEMASKEHVNEWTPQEFSRLLKKHFVGGKIVVPSTLIKEIKKRKKTFWFMAICEKKDAIDFN